MLDISVIVVCFNEEKNIHACLESLVRQSYPIEQCEIIVVDGGSKDRTADIIQEFSDAYANVELVVEPRKGTAIGRNAGVEAARHPYIAFLDADCEAPTDWLERLEAYFQKHREADQTVVAVGGSNVPPPDSAPFVQAVGVAMDSFAGSFNSAQGRQFEEVKYVVSLPTLNVLYEKKAIIDIGGFDVSLGSEAEDAELNYRLYTQGRRFVFIPNMPVLHKFRSTPAIWYKNMVRYGRGRARLLKRYPDMWSLSFVLPPIFLLVICSLSLVVLHPFFAVVGLYFPAIFLYAALLCFRKGRPGLIYHVALVFIVQHFGYATGEVFGLLNPQVR
jgi:succinoglycan biosynthesis protein ExoA